MTGSTSPLFCSAELPGKPILRAIGIQTTLTGNQNNDGTNDEQQTNGKNKTMTENKNDDGKQR
jgi:hypothetical protein